MSDSIIGKENISYRKQRIAETSQSPSLPQTLQFAHKFTGGESTFSLLNMTTPTAELPGFSNPAPSLLSATGLASNPAAMRLHLSTTGSRLIPFDSYRVFGTTIVFLNGVTMPAGAIVFGEIDMIAPNPIVVGDGRFIRKTYQVAVGVTTINLGFQFKVGTNLGSGDQVGDLKVYRNGLLLMRNSGNATASPSADGNYQEVDSGNGYGTSIILNTAPIGQPDSVLVEMGYQISSGQLQIWQELERLQGGLLALAQDAALGFGQPLANYLSTNATELERRAFGDFVTSLGTRVSALELLQEVSVDIPAFNTSANNTYTDVPSSTLVVPSGIWDLTFQGNVSLTNGIGAITNGYANIAILDTSNAIVDNAIQLMGGSTTAAGQALIYPVTLTAKRVPGGTYRLSVRQNAGSPLATNVGGVDYTGSLTGTDSSNRFWARRVR